MRMQGCLSSSEGHGIYSARQGDVKAGASVASEAVGCLDIISRSRGLDCGKSSEEECGEARDSLLYVVYILRRAD